MKGSGRSFANISGPAQRGLGIGIISVVIYLTIVVITTPSLRPDDSIAISVGLNWWLIGGVSIGAGVQAFLLAYAKKAACPVKHDAAVTSASGFFSGLSSFLSFMSLIPLGCCGSWVYILSFLPGLIGASASGFLIANGFWFELIGLGMMAASVTYTYLSVTKRLRTLRNRAGPASPSLRSSRVKLAMGVTLVLVAVAALGAYLNLSHQNGVLRIEVTDAPLNSVSNVYLTISNMTLVGTGASMVSYKVSAPEFDLLSLTNATMFLASDNVPSGSYTLIRFNVTKAVAVVYIPSIGGYTNLTLSIANSEVVIPVQFRVDGGKTTSVVLDITADTSSIKALSNLMPVVIVKSVVGPG